MSGVLFSVLLPTYNERQNLPITLFLLNEIATQHQLSMEIIVIDDNSPDGTAQLVEQITPTFQHNHQQSHLNSFAAHSRQQEIQRLVNRPGKLGLGSAYRDGFKSAKGDFVVIMDADLSHHPKYIPQMVKYPVHQIEGRRNLMLMWLRPVGIGREEEWKGGTQLARSSAGGLTSSQLFSWEPPAAILLAVFDCIKREQLGVLMSQTDTSGYAFQMEMVVRAKRMGWRVEQIPIVFVDRIYGKSKLSGKQSIIYLKSIARLLFEA